MEETWYWDDRLNYFWFRFICEKWNGTAFLLFVIYFFNYCILLLLFRLYVTNVFDMTYVYG